MLTDETDTAVILYTSGTTGPAQGRRAQPREPGAQRARRATGCSARSPTADTHLVTLPLFHSFGSTVQMNAGFAMAATLVLLPRFDAAGRRSTLMQNEDITFFAGVPTMYWGLLGALDDDVDVDRIARNLRIAVAGGASLPVEIIKEFKERFHVQILEGYGLSETSPVATFNQPDRDPRPGSIGVPDLGRRGAS